mgnify:CR=1 FL=1
MRSVIDRLRHRQYTGENRCIPCTVVNISIAVILSAIVGLVSVPVAAVVFVVALITIYLRGYLVPYTPTLTKRYLPDRILRLFDKYPGIQPLVAESQEEIDVERALHDIGAITECRNGTDFCLAEPFQSQWREEIEHVRKRDLSREDAANLLDVDAERLSIREFGDQSSMVFYDDVKVGQWESNAGFLADIAADRVLSEEHPEWAATHVLHRGQILSALRMFLERCPSCDAPVEMGEDTVESCCRSIDVVAVNCTDCDARIFEVELTPELRAQL